MESDMGGRGDDRNRTRADIVDVAARLINEGGVGAVTTRSVAAAAGVQAPTIYRLFGDKEGLLDAVAEHVFSAYVDTKRSGVQTDDALADLDRGWSTHVGFGLANPALFTLLAEPERGKRLTASAGGIDILRERVHRVALAGRLAVTERRAVDMIHAAGTGVVLALLAMPIERRDSALADSIYAAIKRAVLTDVDDAPSAGISAAAIALRAGLSETSVLSEAERVLMAEWLDRIAAD
ncbi:helix-turn-helix domain containing protein [Microbacterium sp. STN6]|uniref:TetR/AcrR family transcriptional regulator n=1 Tax=Microbacterium sp. STN6 TaxID=2995588 RepID=UPI0022608754|nr:TetR/AcrR family transcriptional regulator [Microbacterium sp. STN6]MCX7521273.1 helix-turn-helix domain containing protein [Microbacterium sp. STN6]